MKASQRLESVQFNIPNQQLILHQSEITDIQKKKEKVVKQVNNVNNFENDMIEEDKNLLTQQNIRSIIKNSSKVKSSVFSTVARDKLSKEQQLARNILSIDLI